MKLNPLIHYPGKKILLCLRILKIYDNSPALSNTSTTE